jgi:hypothetical protein
MQLRFRYLVEDVDRHGNIRLYIRLPGRPKVRIREPFGTDEFIAAYNAAVSDHVTAPRQARQAKAPPGCWRPTAAFCSLVCSTASSSRSIKTPVKTLWKFKTGSAINSPPITYTHQRRQFVTVLSGVGGAVNRRMKGYDLIPTGGSVTTFALISD